MRFRRALGCMAGVVAERVTARGRAAAARQGLRAAAMLAAAALAAACAAPASRPDDAREARWAAEIVPGVVVGEPVFLATPHRARVLALLTVPKDTRGGVVLVHGAGVHPDWGLVGALRERLADAGYTTLSVQMPVLAAGAQRGEYRSLYDDAGARIDAAVAFLQDHGSSHIAIVSHSLGAAMTNAYLAGAQPRTIDAWVPIGMVDGFDAPPREPVLDVVAADDLAEVKTTAPRRRAGLPLDRCSEQVVVAGADHFFARQIDALTERIGPFIARAFARAC